MRINFTKMQGCANDYIYINCMEQEISNPSKLAIEMSRRHFSVGADGIVLICKSNVANAYMRMFNADGSEGKMCGNAIRCVGKYLYDNNIYHNKELKVETLSGIKTLNLYPNEYDLIEKVTVDMGFASFDPAQIPLKEGVESCNQTIVIDNKSYKATCVNVGNPHCVIFTNENIEDFNLNEIGPKFENHTLFPERINTEFVNLLNGECATMRVWERGSGETYACGTGACAICAAGVSLGIFEPNKDILIKLKGGNLNINCDENYNLRMTGPAKKVYEGVYDYEN